MSMTVLQYYNVWASLFIVEHYFRETRANYQQLTNHSTTLPVQIISRLFWDNLHGHVTIIWIHKSKYVNKFNKITFILFVCHCSKGKINNCLGLYTHNLEVLTSRFIVNCEFINLWHSTMSQNLNLVPGDLQGLIDSAESTHYVFLWNKDEHTL